jgi:hypothetical protein
MLRRGKVVKIIAGVAAVSLSVSTAAAPTGLAAASSSPVAPRAASIDPLVAVSLFASSASQAALCGAAGVTAAATSAAATTAQPGAGCVLPAVEVPPIAGAGAGVPVGLGAAPLAFGGISGPAALALALAGVAGIVAAAGGFRGDGIRGRPTLSPR